MDTKQFIDSHCRHCGTPVFEDNRHCDKCWIAGKAELESELTRLREIEAALPKALKAALAKDGDYPEYVIDQIICASGAAMRDVQGLRNALEAYEKYDCPVCKCGPGKHTSGECEILNTSLLCALTEAAARSEQERPPCAKSCCGGM